MVSCEICRKGVQASDRPVKCSGPCTKVFHLLCADLNLTYGRALAAKLGLYWFCAKCRVVLDQQGTTPDKAGVTLVELSRRLDAVEKAFSKDKPDEDSIGSGSDTVSALDLLPEEIWIKLFRSLTGFQLRQIRMTCRSWNQIVGHSSTLMGKLLLRLPKNILLEEDCKEIELLSASKSLYSNIVMEEVRIIGVNSWWATVADHLETLVITKCQITIATLLTMLEPLRNLKKLSFTCGPFVDVRSCPGKINFQLPSLETLTLLEVDHGDLLDVFRQICPRLREFRLPSGNCPEVHPQKVTKLIEATKGTLQEVELPMVLRLWQSLNGIGGVRLKGISLTACQERSAMKESHLISCWQKHSGIETFSVELNCETALETIGRYLPNLKRLKISHRGRTHAAFNTFLNQMLDLVQLDIRAERYYSATFDATNCRNNSLKILNLENWTIPNSYSNAFPYISHLSLTDCRVQSWSIVLDPSLKCLQRVTLKSIHVEKTEECLADYFQKLKYLSISGCQMGTQFLVALFSLCPKLEEVKLENVREVNNDVVTAISKKLKNLKKISVTDYSYNDKYSPDLVEKLRLRVEFCRFSSNYTRHCREEYFAENYTDSDYSD